MAGSLDRNWGVGSKSRGTRSQFRLEGLHPFKCTYPVHLTDMMDAVQSTQPGLLRPDFSTSPLRENRTRAVREYEETIEQFRKENFDLKLRIFLMEEENKKKYHNRNECGDETENTVQVIVNLRMENENLRQMLSEKELEQQSALELTEKYESDLKELQDKLSVQQDVVALLEEGPTAEDINKMTDMMNQNEFLSNLLSEKTKELEEANAKLEESLDIIAELEKKVEVRNSAIKGCALKYKKETDKIPMELKSIVITAIEAAHSNNESEIISAVEDFKAYLCQIMPEPPRVLRTELQSKSPRQFSLKNSSEKQRKSGSSSKSPMASSSKERVLPHNVTSPAENAESSSTCSFEDTNQEDLESLIESSLLNYDAHNFEESEKLAEIVSQALGEKDEITQRINQVCYNFEKRIEEIEDSNNKDHKLEESVQGVKDMDTLPERRENEGTPAFSTEDSPSQTDINWPLLHSKISDFGNSNDAEVLKEEVLMLLLALEQKDKELADSSQKLISLQTEMENIVNKNDINTLATSDEELSVERDELKRRLAMSCSINNELLRHLQSLEQFMEELLQQKNMSTSSLENIDETTDFFSKLSKCLDESLQLSHHLSNQLSICEEGKNFEPDEGSINPEFSFSNKVKSYESLLTSNFSQNESDVLSQSQEGRNNFFISSKELNKNYLGTGKRRLSFSTFPKSSMEPVINEPDNVVVLKTSNNEDLILLLNDRGDPEDVLIRNNESLLNNNLGGDQLRRRCWETSMNSSFWNNERLAASHTKNVYNFEHLNTSKPSCARYNSWLSSDSDTWSEPDRNVSLQRIGIDVQSSPVTSKSPRKSRFKDKRMGEDSTKNESASSYVKLHSWSKRRRSSETSKLATGLQNKEEMIRFLYEEKRILFKQISDLKTELEEIKRNNNLLQLQRNESVSKLKEKDKMNDTLNTIINELENKMLESDKFCDEVQLELSQTKQRLVDLDNKCSEYEEKLSSCLKDNEVCKEDLRYSKQKESDLSEDIKELTLQKDSLLDKLKIEEDSKKYLENENFKLQEKIRHLENNNEGLNSEIKTLEDILGNLKSKCVDHEKENYTLLDKLKIAEDCKKYLENENSKLQEKIRHLENNNERLNSEIKTLEDILGNLKSKCVDYEKENNILLSAKQSIVEKLLRFGDSFISNVNLLSSIFDKSFSLSTENLKNDYSADELEKLAKKIDLENVKFKELVDGISKQCQETSVKITKSKLALEEEKSKAALFQQQLELKEDKIRILKEELEQLQNSFDRLKQATSDSAMQTQPAITASNDGSDSKYSRKLKSLQAKLDMSEKRIEILEKEKSSLRKQLLKHMQEIKIASISSEDLNTTREKMSDLESKLETKQSFIKELKSDLYKANDALIDKQKENDKLQRELLKYRQIAESNSQNQYQNILNRLSDSSLHSKETSISDLKKEKHELIDSLLNLQKQFYEAKNIHLKHFEKFCSHIESLRSLQMLPSLLKSESVPVLNTSFSDSQYSQKWDRVLKNTQIDLEIDIECLQNFKIFLKRFFTPIMLQNCLNSTSDKKNDDPSVSSSNHSSKEVAIQAVVPIETVSKTEIKKSFKLPFKRSFENIEQLQRKQLESPHDRLSATAGSISQKLDWVENVLKNVANEIPLINEPEHIVNETSREAAAKAILQKISEGLHYLQENADEVFYLNSALKSLELFSNSLPLNTSKQDVSDRESLLSEDTIALSQSGSLSPVSFDEHFPASTVHQRLGETGHSHSYPRHSDGNKRTPLMPPQKLLSSSQESDFQRSHYSSPDLGIESDPNHEHSAPEQVENFHSSKNIGTRYDKSSSSILKSLEIQKNSSYSFDTSIILKDQGLPFSIGQTLYAIGILEEYELLKKEVAESLVGIKSILSRTGDGLQHLSSYTSPRKKLEYTTFKAIKDTCSNIQVCLQKAHKLILNFSIYPCATEKELKILLQHNEELNTKLKKLYESKKKQEKEFNEFLERFKKAEIFKEQQERKISKKLVKTKRVIRLAEKKILESKNAGFSSLIKDTSKIPDKL